MWMFCPWTSGHIQRFLLIQLKTSAVQIVFLFRIESNSYRQSQKSPVNSKDLSNKFNCFYSTADYVYSL